MHRRSRERAARLRPLLPRLLETRSDPGEAEPASGVCARRALLLRSPISRLPRGPTLQQANEGDLRGSYRRTAQSSVVSPGRKSGERTHPIAAVLAGFAAVAGAGDSKEIGAGWMVAGRVGEAIFAPKRSVT